MYLEMSYRETHECMCLCPREIADAPIHLVREYVLSFLRETCVSVYALCKYTCKYECICVYEITTIQNIHIPLRMN